MKRTLSLVFLLLLFAFCTFGAVADDNTTQEYRLSAFGDSYTMSITSPQPAFWEQPDLKAGETALNDGYLVLTNSTDEPQTLTFANVSLPYADKDALLYLNHLHITVSHNGEVLYEGPYSEINNGGFATSETLQPQQSTSYTIRLYCDYTYSGEVPSDSKALDWNFSGKGQNSQSSDKTNADLSRIFEDALFKEILIAVGVTVIIIIILLVIDRRKDRE